MHLSRITYRVSRSSSFRCLPSASSSKLRDHTIRNIWLLASAICFLAACDRENSKHQNIADVAAVELTRPQTLVSADSLAFQDESFGAKFAAQNRVILPNLRESTVSVFDSLGRQTVQVGGRGEGPGSLAGLGSAFLFGDTLAVFDNNRLKLYHFVNGKLIAPSLDFSNWPSGGTERLRLIGRFVDGRWVAIHMQRQNRSPGNVREYADSTVLLVGQPQLTPDTLLQLPIQTRLVVRQGSSTILIALDEVAPSYVSVCDSGVVVLDSSEVKYYNVTGQLTSKVDLRRTKIPFLAARRDGILRLQMSGIEPGPVAYETQKAISSQLDKLSQVLPPALLDSRGQVWLMHHANLEFERVDRAGNFDFAFKSQNGVLAIGESRVLTSSIDRSTDLPTYAMFQSNTPASLRPTTMGWCQGMFAW